MTAAVAELSPTPTAPVLVALSPTRTVEDGNAIELIADVEAFVADTLPGCGEDNPYN